MKKLTRTMINYQETIDGMIFRDYSKGTKLENFKRTTRLNLHELAQILAGSEYTFMVLSKVKEVVSAEHQLLFIYNIQPTEYYDVEFSNMIRTYHIDKDHKYFSFWMEEYYSELERKSNNLLRNTKNGYEFKVTKDDITIPKPGETMYDIGHYKNNPITIDDMIKSNWKYAYYIIKTFDNSPFQHIFYYIYTKLKDLKERNAIEVELTTEIPLETLKAEYNKIYNK